MKSIVSLIINIIIATIFTIGLFLYPETVSSQYFDAGVVIVTGLMIIFIAFIFGMLTKSIDKFVYPVILTVFLFISNEVFDWGQITGITDAIWIAIWILGFSTVGLVAGSAIRQCAVKVVEHFTE